MNRLALALILVSPAALADADPSNGEQRCDELGNRCVCSEPLNMAGFSYSQDQGAAARHNPDDSVVKECGLNEAGFPWYSGKTRWTSTSIPDALDANSLPQKDPSIQRFLGPETPSTNQSGTMFVGHRFQYTPGHSNMRRAIRWYTYYDSSFVFCGGGHQNSKQWESVFDSYWTWGGGGTPLELTKNSTSEPSWSVDGSSAVNGRFSGRPMAPMNSIANWRDKWIRWEIVVDNGEQNSPNGTRMRMYMKNVSDGTAEIKLLDSYAVGVSPVDCPACFNGAWTGAGFEDLRDLSGAPGGKLQINNYAQGDVCPPGSPYKGMSHMMVAAWDEADMAAFDLWGADVQNDINFRIGSAAELEGETGVIDPDLPRPNTNEDLIAQ